MHFYVCFRFLWISLLDFASCVVSPNSASVYIHFSFVAGCLVWVFFSLYVAVPSELYFYCLALVLFSKATVIPSLYYCFYCTLVLHFFYFFFHLI